MGKKSRKSKNKHKRKVGGVAPLTAAASLGTSDGAPPSHKAAGVEDKPPSPPPGAVCWICFEGDPDKGGKPIVRDCSCRGDDAGFAHLSCLVSYAETKSKELAINDDHAYLLKPWKKCPNCCQNYQRRLALDMVKFHMLFIGDNYQNPPGMWVWKLEVFDHMLSTLNDMDYRGSSALREEGKRAAKQTISEIEGIDIVTKENNASYIERQRILAYICLGNYAKEDGTGEGYELALQSYKEVRNYYLSEGDNKEAMSFESRMKMVKARRDGDVYLPSTADKEALKSMRDRYEKITTKHRDNATCAAERVQAGLNLAQQLSHIEGYGIECERLLNDLEPVSCLILGPDHPLTKEVRTGVERSRQQEVLAVTDHGVYECNALSFDCSTSTYSVEGEFPDGATDQFGIDELVMATGTPVICHGLKNATHLNGKIGDVMCYDADACRYEVRFEHKGLKPASVKAANLRILFDISDKHQNVNFNA